MLPVSGAALLVACSGKYLQLEWTVEMHLRSSCRATKLLTHQAVLKIGETSTLLVVTFGQEHVPQAELLCLLLELFDDGWMAPSAFLCSGFGDLCTPDGVGGNTFLIDELLDDVERLLRTVAHLVAQDGGDAG